MSILKKFAAPLVAVALVAMMGVSLLGSTRNAEAAVVVTVANATINRTLNATNGTGGFTALGNIVFTSAAANDILAGNIVIAAPTGWQFDAATAPVVTKAGTTLAVTSPATVASDGSTITVVVTTSDTTNDGVLTVTAPRVRPLTNSTATGNMTVSSSSTSVPVGVTAGTTNLGTLTAGTAITGPYTLTVTALVTTLPADASQTTALSAALRDANSALVSNTPINWSSSVGIIGTGTSKTGTSVTTTSGNAAQSTYRCNSGTAGTDTIIASSSNLSVVGTLSITCTTSSGTTAAAIKFNSPSASSVAATRNQGTANYFSPTVGARISVKVSDAAGLGVNSQIVLITVDKGFILSGFNTTLCPGTTKAVTGTTADLAAVQGATAEAGIIQLTYCGDQDSVGQATLTAQNVSTTMANATSTISTAGRPSKIEATVSGTTVKAMATDDAGNTVANGTPIRFTISTNSGVVSPTCTTSSGGSASAVVALDGAAGNVIVSADNSSASPTATCAAAGSRQISASAAVGAGASTPPPASGGGSFAAAPVFSSSKLAQVVFNGGTVAQLEGAVVAAGGTGVWAQDAQGNFVLYIVNGGFVNEGFSAAFPTGFSGVTAVTVVGK